MKKVGRLYNKTAVEYQSQSTGIHNNSMAVALKQLEESGHFDLKRRSVVDLGVGTGAFLKRYADTKQGSELTGVDVSREMLAIASNSVPMRTIHSSIHEIDQHLSAHQFDLVVAHFISSFVGMDMLIEKARYLLVPGGLISISTTTGESFSHNQEAFYNKKSCNPLMYFFKKMLNRAIKNNPVPNNIEDIKAMCEQHGLAMVGRCRSAHPINLRSSDDMVKYAIDDGWFVGFYNHWWFPSFLVNPVTKMFAALIEKPFYDEVIVETVLLRV